MKNTQTNQKASATADKSAQGIWDEKNKKWIRPSGTVKQGRRPMFEPFDDTCPKCGSSTCTHAWEIDAQQAGHSPLPLALQRAKDALVGDSNDEEHDALLELIEHAKEDEQRIETAEFAFSKLAQAHDRTLAHAEALAEALRQIKSAMEHHFSPFDRHWCIEKAREALANWEGAK